MRKSLTLTKRSTLSFLLLLRCIRLSLVLCLRWSSPLKHSSFCKRASNSLLAGSEQSTQLCATTTSISQLHDDGQTTDMGTHPMSDYTLHELPTSRNGPVLSNITSRLTQFGMLTYIAGMCITLPLILLPPTILLKLKMISRVQREKLSLRGGQFCSRWLMRLIPFAKIKVINPSGKSVTEPSVWVCNHISMLDVFFLLAVKKHLVARPMKIVYWKGLEANPVTKALFTACGFISVNMADNGNGNDNEYDKSSFKALLKGTKQAFEEGFDMGILPEGQLNPHPEKGLLPIFNGAVTLAKLSKRPIRMMALHGTNNLWSPREEQGMKCNGRTVSVRIYSEPLQFDDAKHFSETFTKVVGYFGAHGKDMPENELQKLLKNASANRSKTAVAM